MSGGWNIKIISSKKRHLKNNILHSKIKVKIVLYVVKS